MALGRPVSNVACPRRDKPLFTVPHAFDIHPVEPVLASCWAAQGASFSRKIFAL